MQYRFRIERPINVDATVLILTRYYDDTQEVLYVDGWHEYQDWEVFDLNKVPKITGPEGLEARRVQALLDQFRADFANAIVPAVPAPWSED